MSRPHPRILSALTLSALLAACGQQTSAPEPASAPQASASAPNRPAAASVPKTPFAEAMPEDLLQRFAWSTRRIRHELAGATPQQADALYERHLEETRELANQIEARQQDFLSSIYADEYWQETASGLQPTEAMLAKQKALADVGLQYWDVGEGIVVIRPQPDYFLKLFGQAVSPDYRDFITIQAEQDKELDYADAGLVISWAELGKRVHAWEDFIQRHPDSKLADTAKIRYTDYQRSYLIGTDNTPVFDYQSNTIINSEAQADWQNYAKQYPKSATAALIAEVPNLPVKGRWEAFAQLQQSKLGFKIPDGHEETAASQPQ